MTVRFISVPGIFGPVLVAAGTGTVAQFTYTTPVGKRAILTYARVQGNANANAALTSFIVVDVFKAAVSNVVLRRDLSGLVGAQLNAETYCDIDLDPNDQVRILSVNTGAGGVNMGATVFIREYT